MRSQVKGVVVELDISETAGTGRQSCIGIFYAEGMGNEEIKEKETVLCQAARP